MAFQIIWTANALEDYHRVVDYLLTEWSVRVASGFITTLEERLNSFSSLFMAPFIIKTWQYE